MCMYVRVFASVCMHFICEWVCFVIVCREKEEKGGRERSSGAELAYHRSAEFEATLEHNSF